MGRAGSSPGSAPDSAWGTRSPTHSGASTCEAVQSPKQVTETGLPGGITHACNSVGLSEQGAALQGAHPAWELPSGSAQAPTVPRDRGWCLGRPLHLPGVGTEGTEHHAGEVGVQVLLVEGAEVQVTVQDPPRALQLLSVKPAGTNQCLLQMGRPRGLVPAWAAPLSLPLSPYSLHCPLTHSPIRVQALHKEAVLQPVEQRHLWKLTQCFT